VSEQLALALASGLIAAVNPCGFALLPAYLSLLVIDADDVGRAPAVRRAVVSTVALTVGFIAVFGLFGLVIAPLAIGIQAYLPYVTTGLGVAVVLAGLWLLAGRSLPALGWSPRGSRPSRRFLAMVGFGATYALASLTCTIAPFLAIVIGSFRSGSVPAGLALFVAYGIGMGLLVGAAALAVALARGTFLDRLRRWGGGVPRAAGALLVVVGAYVAYYGWWELQVLAGSATDDPVIATAAALQARLSAAVATLGAGGVLAAAGVLGLLAVVVGVVRRQRTSAVARQR